MQQFILLFSSALLAFFVNFTGSNILPTQPEVFSIPASPTLVCDRVSDSLALIELYNATDGPNWTTTWDLNQPIDTWFGVQLNAEGCVECLDLDGTVDCDVRYPYLGNGLSGALPDLNLPNLSHLILDGNNLSGSIPNFLNLPSLETLVLISNQFNGNITDFSNIPLLKVLRLGNNEFNGAVPDFSNLPNLVYLSLGGNQLSGSIPDFSNIPRLEILGLDRNRLTGSIPNFSNIPELFSISLRYNQLSGPIPDFSNISKLEHTLNLDNNQLEGPIPDFSNIPKLKFHNFADNKLTGPIPNFSNLPNLILVQVQRNKIDGPIPDFSNMPSLRDVYIFDNLFTFEDILPSITSIETQISGNYLYNTQQNFFPETTFSVAVGNPFSIDLQIDDAVSTNVYQWYKDDVLYQTIQGNNELSFAEFSADDLGIYHCVVTNPNAPNLSLSTNDISLIFGGVAGCRTADSLALVELYNATDGPNWTTSWDLNQPIDTWSGVQLNAGGCVECLDLDGNPNCSDAGVESGMGLNGTLPDLNLPYLLSLNLAENNLSGNIPNFTHLEQLEFLKLTLNSFSGNIPNFSNLPQLETLDLRANNLDGPIPNFTALPNLEKLDLEYNDLTGNIPDFSNFPYLNTLALRSNELTGEIPDFSNLPYLIDLLLSHNALEGAIPNFSNLPLLDLLYLSSNQLSGEIPDFSNLSKLRRLFLDNNLLSGAIPNFSALTRLSTLSLKDNQLSGCLPAFSGTPNLIYTYFDNNNLSCVIPAYENLTTFRALHCVGNQFTFEHILPNIDSLEALIDRNRLIGSGADTFNYATQQAIDIDDLLYATMGEPFVIDLQIDDTVTTNVYEWYKFDQPYQTVQGTNELTFSDFSPEDVGIYHCRISNPNAPNLQLISDDIYVNLLGAPSCRESDSLALVELYNLTDGPNWSNSWDLNQSLDTWYGVQLNQVGCVESLDLSNNGLAGTLPDLNLNALRVLELDQNNLQGNIPAFLSLPLLEELQLSLNSLVGSVPDFSFPKLYRLALAANNLDGTIPNFTGLPQLERLFLNDNTLSGPVPDLINCPKLTYFNLWSNQLTGDVPDFQLPNLTSFSLSYNPLGGSIPDFSNLANVTFFDIYYGQLTGTLPDFSNMPKLRSITLPGNQFEGNIPDFSSLPELSALNLSHNNFEGNIPEFSNVPKLSRLLLDYNELSGCLPNFNNNPLIYQIEVDNNQLDCEIPSYNNLPNLEKLYLQYNNLTFEDILPSFDALQTLIGENGDIDDYQYQPQSASSPNTAHAILEGENFTIDLIIDDTVSTSRYQWYKDNVTYQEIIGDNELNFDAVQTNDAGVYNCVITNPNVPGLSLFSGFTTLTTIGLCRTPDSLALVEFYNALDGPNWTNTWDLNQPIDTWFGVTVNAAGCVTQLHLRNNQLTGTLIDLNLTNLVSIDLLLNNISGNIPDFQNLPKLEKLYLDRNQLSGCIPEFKQSPLLSIIWIEANDLECRVPSFSHLLQLSNLRINDNQFTFEDILPTVDSIETLIASNSISSYERYEYAPQQIISHNSYIEGNSYIIDLVVDDTISNNVYQWFKDNVPYQEIQGESRLIIENYQVSDSGVYNCLITNPGAPELTLNSAYMIINISDPLPECDAQSLVLDQNPIPSAIYQVADTIKATGIVEVTADVTFIAGKTIRLLPDFHAEAGALFQAYIEDCELPAQASIQNLPPTIGAALLQNTEQLALTVFPNPSRHSTNLQYQLPETNSVHLFISDLNGRVVQVVKAGTTQAAGTHKLQIDLSDLSGGIYNVHLLTPQEKVHHRMVVIE